MSLRVGVMGAAGYAGMELVRLLSAHPSFELAVITSDAEVNEPISEVYPAFIGCEAPRFSAHDDPALLDCDLVFLAVPHTVSLAHSPRLIEAGVSVIDLSADYRLADPLVYEHWYGVAHSSTDLLARRHFGLPELFPEDMKEAAARHRSGEAVLVACAGCYPTATSLAAAPLIRAGLQQGIVVVDAVSGVSGAGKKPTERTHFCSASSNLEAYKVGAHRHTPEIGQILGREGKVVFTPHLAPLSRGLLSTVTMELTSEAKATDPAEIQRIYEDFYRDQPFVEVLPAGVLPKTSSVAGTNKAHVAVVVEPELGCVVALGAIDNLCKGAAGQAVQCANLVCDFDQGLGLPTLALSL